MSHTQRDTRETRKFQGREYQLAGVFASESELASAAEQAQADGYLIRTRRLWEGPRATRVARHALYTRPADRPGRARRGGRPRKEISDLQSDGVSVTFSRADYHEVQRLARRAGMDLAEYLRAAGLRAKLVEVPAINLRAYRRLSYQVALLYQVTQRVRVDGLRDDDRAVLESLRDEIAGMRSALRYGTTETGRGG